ncbi:glycosyltransferase family 2 protein [Roseateles sp. YR242]|uniref:glycosyltransferase family 2 protein n=1 Tax=Roseateles sp. YR242 TaxID=1855305 RepID=UPI000B84EC4D|nr:glycosyltransferase family 2 protein [Roseateles sp. YR242]
MSSTSVPRHADHDGSPGNSPWLSVLIPVYNVKNYLRECLASVLAQADAGVEVWMADDCSSDGTTELVQALVAEHAGGPVPVRALIQTRNQGPSVSRNALLQQARGEYIWFLDADDCLQPGAMARLREVVDQHAPGLVMCDFAMLRLRKKLKYRLRGEMHRHTFFGPERQLISDPAVLLRGLFEAGHLHVWSKIAKRQVWGEQLRFPVGRYFEDVTLTPRLVLQAGSVWYEPEVWVAYRQHEGSILATPNLIKADHQVHALVTLRETADRLGLDEHARFPWAHFVACAFIGASRTAERGLPGRWGGTVAVFRQAFEQSSPLSTRALLQAYLWRGWWGRAIRLAYWLKRAEGESTMAADSGFA